MKMIDSILFAYDLVKGYKIDNSTKSRIIFTAVAGFGKRNGEIYFGVSDVDIDFRNAVQGYYGLCDEDYEYICDVCNGNYFEILETV